MLFVEFTVFMIDHDINSCQVISYVMLFELQDKLLIKLWIKATK